MIFGIGATLVGTGATPSSIAAIPSSIYNSPILRKAAKRAVGGGISGAIAGVAQVITLMWLRTTMNYQYRYGTSTGEALRKLYNEGGILRFYQGVQFAILQTPLSRFGDTAANTGVLELLAMTAWGVNLPIAYKTALASAAGSLWRIALTPLDTLKTTLQVEGPEASALLMKKVQAHGLGVLYNGAGANALASFVGSFPWFWVFNQMDAALPAPPPGVLILKLLRSAALGVSATCVSDIISNSLRVMKTTRQTSSEPISYAQAVAQIVEKDGYLGLFTRGLGTRLITNCIQASIFTIVWKLLEERLNAKA